MTLSALPTFVPDFSGVMAPEVAALTPVLSNALQSAFGQYKPTALGSGIVKEAPIDDSNRLILIEADRPTLMRIWQGDRVIQPIAIRNQDITPDLYEATIGIPKTTFQDSARIANVWNGVFANWGTQMAAFPDYLAGNALALASSVIGYDGKEICSDSHPIDPENPGAGTWSNLFANTPLTTENLASAYASFMQVPGRDGLPWSNRQPGSVKLVVPSQLAFAAEQATGEMVGRIVQSDTGVAFGTSPETNVRLSKLGIEVVVLQTLTDQTTWFLMDTASGAYPTLVMGMREPFVITPMISPQSQNVFMKNQFLWGVTGRLAVGYALPQNLLQCSA